MSVTSAVKHRVTGRHVLGGMLAFFGLILAANSVFLYSAFSTYSGVVADEPYRKGLRYNDRIAAGEQQNELGWQTDLQWSAPDKRLVLKVLNRSGEPLIGLRVVGTVGRPATQQKDHRLTFADQGAGLYVAEPGTLESGSWLASVEAVQAGDANKDVVYRLRRRLWVAP